MLRRLDCRLPVVAILACTLAVRAECQARNAGALQLTTSIERDDGTVVQLGTQPRGFNLFADADLAGTGMKLTGTYRWAQFNAGGLCSFASTAGDLYNSACGSTTLNGSTFFHLQSVWGVPISEYRKIRAVWPDVAGMQPPIGYSTPWRITSIGPRVLRIGPADGQFGTYFSGVVSEVGGGCREMSGNPGANFPNGLTLTASSDCPETWAGGRFDGIRAIPDSAWLGEFRKNPGGFRWDDWRIPPAHTRDAAVLGNNATYGAFSDHNREILAMYGRVTPHALGTRTERGFPLGIEVRYDAYRFDRTTLRDGVFVRWYVINNSAKVWGQGIDYDSLYMGVDPAYTSSNRASYNVVAKGAHVIAAGGTSGRCSTTFPRRVPPGANQACGTGGTSHPRVIMLLKSPIGDLRNKLFTKPGPFNSPNHPKADDTITYNHWRRGGFGAMLDWAWRYNDRALFGYIAGDETRFLDGRQPNFMSAGNVWIYFMNEFTDGTAAERNWRWNRSVPGAIPGYGKWDYNDDGIQDTLIIPDCGVAGCSVLWSDTIAGGFSAKTYGSLGNYLGVGPFSLRAGDTTSFIWFLGTGQDTTAMNRLIRNVTDAYLANFPAAQGYPAVILSPGDVQVRSAWLRSADTVDGTEIRIRLRTVPGYADPYLARVVALLESDDPTAVTLRRLNPTLVAIVRGRMQQNLADVLVFKSCDRGVTWTADANCTASVNQFRLRDAAGNLVGLGWTPRFIVRADSVTGALTPPVVTDIVESGREYLYVTITRTRGLRDIPVTMQLTVDSAGAVLSERRGTLADALGVDVDTIVAPLAPNGGNSATVYAPLTEPAGSVYARVDTATVQGHATRRVQTIVQSPGAEGIYRLRFGNRFIVTRTQDTITGSRSTRVIRESIYASAVVDATGARMSNFVASADTLFGSHDIVTVGVTLSTVPRTTVGSTRVFVDTISTLGYVVAQGGSQGSAPLALLSGFTTLGLAYEGAAFYPGFTFRFASEPTQGTLIDRGGGDTVRPSVPAANAVQWSSPAQTAPLGGYYRVVWRGDSFGPHAPFRWGHPDSIRAAVAASLRLRWVSVTGVTDPSISQLPNFPAGTRPLVAIQVPFEVYGIDGSPAAVAMLQRHTAGNVLDSLFRNSRLFGTSGDTVRVPVQPYQWMPGDTLFVIERVVRDSVVGQGIQAAVVVRDTVVNGRLQRLPIQVVDTIMGQRLVFGCISDVTPGRTTCNPIRAGEVGSSTYLPTQNGWTATTHIVRLFDQNSEMQLSATPQRVADRPLTRADAQQVQVVPNPFVVQSAYDAIGADRNVTASRIMFVNVPLEGVLRVYSISGQLIRQQTWTAADLSTTAGVSTGDLPFDLRTTSGREMAPGLYLYVLTGRSANARGFTARGKFVVIR